MSPDANDTTRAILSLLAEGLDVRDILRHHATLTEVDVQQAAAEGLAALELGESREARIARVRRTHPRAFMPWERGEDARLMEAFAQGAPLAHIARELQRPPGAIRARLERQLGSDWRDARPASSPRRRDARDRPSSSRSSASS